MENIEISSYLNEEGVHRRFEFTLTSGMGELNVVASSIDIFEPKGGRMRKYGDLSNLYRQLELYKDYAIASATIKHKKNLITGSQEAYLVLNSMSVLVISENLSLNVSMMNDDYEFVI